MKKIQYIVCAAIMAAAGASCSKEAFNQSETPVSPERGTLTISVYSEDAGEQLPDTRVSFTDNSATTSVFSVKWDETIANEKLRVLGKDSGGEYVAEDNLVYTGSSRINDHKADFTGTAPTDASASFDVLYPSDYTSLDDFNTRGFGQKQASSGSTAHLAYNAKITGLTSLDELKFYKSAAEAAGLGFYCTSALKVQLQVPDDVTEVKELSIISSDPENFYRTNDPDSKTGILSIGFNDGTVAA